MIVMIKELHEMTGLEFHQIAALRTQVFVVEQNCPYQEVDAIDLIAKHLCIFDEQQQLVSYARIYFIEGKVQLNRFYPNAPIEIEAQAHLQKFYGKYNFVTVSDPFDEDGILHVVMRKEK